MKEIMEIILASAGIFVLAFVLAKVLILNYDEDDKTAESYLETLEEQMKIAESGDEGSFEMLARYEDTHFYLIYFGNKVLFKVGSKSFSPSEIGKNNLCVCYSSDGGNICRRCIDFKGEVSLDSFGEEWGVVAGEKVSINFVEDKYVFKKA